MLDALDAHLAEKSLDARDAFDAMRERVGGAGMDEILVQISRACLDRLDYPGARRGADALRARIAAAGAAAQEGGDA